MHNQIHSPSLMLNSSCKQSIHSWFLLEFIHSTNIQLKVHEQSKFLVRVTTWIYEFEQPKFWWWNRALNSLNLSKHTQRRFQSIQCFGSTDIKSDWWRHSTQSILTKTTVGELSMFKSPKSSKFLQTSYWIYFWHKLHYIDLEEWLYLE